jgi:hypothetical protein
MAGLLNGCITNSLMLMVLAAFFYKQLLALRSCLVLG